MNTPQPGQVWGTDSGYRLRIHGYNGDGWVQVLGVGGEGWRGIYPLAPFRSGAFTFLSGPVARLCPRCGA